MDETDRRVVQLEARIKRLEAAMRALLFRLDINPAEIMPQEASEARGLHDDIQAALLAGDKIRAIKLYRAYYGVDLKTAKDAIDAL
ncbi:MAG TPA: hypothetical protein VKR06_30345 [Ktedonosporobacter sp.]|nr:hypothetical protein [Ktedonosporobacter sp.]